MFGKQPGIFAFWLLQIGNSVIIPSVDLMCILRGHGLYQHVNFIFQEQHFDVR